MCWWLGISTTPEMALNMCESQKGGFWLANLERMCRSRAGKGRQGQEGCPWLGKKGRLRSFYLCVFCCVVCCVLVFPPQHRLQPLACKQTVKKKYLLPSAWILPEMWVGDVGDEISSSLLRPVSAADFEQHWVMAKDIRNSLEPKKPLPASQRGFPATSLMCSASGIQWLAQIYLFVLFTSVLSGKDLSVSPPMAQAFLSAPAKSKGHWFCQPL